MADNVFAMCTRIRQREHGHHDVYVCNGVHNYTVARLCFDVLLIALLYCIVGVIVALPAYPRN